MPSPRPKADRKRRDFRKGFALVLSLGLMALIVLLLLTLSAMLQVESVASQQHLHLALARQNALAGAHQALGVLQTELGPDMRVSARADITGDASMRNPYWVGAWSTASVSADTLHTGKALAATPHRWLVSMPSTGSASVNPSTAIASADSVTLFNGIAIASDTGTPSSLSNPVTVYRVAISANDAQMGGYAWWISDEGLKASISLDSSTETTSAQNGISAEDQKTRRQLFKMRQGIETVSHEDGFSIPEDTRLDGAAMNRLNNVLSPRQLPLLSDNGLFTSTRATELSHDLTGRAYGVLASTLTVASNQTLKTDFSTAGDISSVVGASSEGVLAFLRAYKTVETVDGRPVFPLTPTIPDDGETPVTGKAYFSIVPLLSELEISSSVFISGYSTVFAAAAPVGDKTTLQARMGAWFELWNPYTTAIKPKNGHIQVRLVNPPAFRVRHWYDKNLNASDPSWAANTPSVSSLIKFADTWKSSSGDYMAFHLLHQSSTSTSSVLYEAGNPLYWFGARAAKATKYANNDYTLGDEFVSAYGAAKEPFEDGTVFRRYFQADGAVSYKTMARSGGILPIYPIAPANVTAEFCQNVLLNQGIITASVYNTMAAELASGKSFSSYSNSPYYYLWKYYTAMTLDWDTSIRTTAELWYVPDNSSRTGDTDKAVRLSSVKLPAFADTSSNVPPPSGTILDTKYQVLNDCDNKRYSVHYWRVDGSDIPEGVRRTRDGWLTSSASMDPRSPQQTETSFDFFGDLADPNNGYTDYAKSGSKFILTTYPDPDGTLTQQLDRKTGVLNNGATISSQNLGEYILGLSSNVTISSPGGTHPAHRVSLFEIPTTVPISLGTLQHVTLGGRRPYSVGNSWGRRSGIDGANLNLIFDKGYLSALPTGALSGINPNETLPNPYLLPLWSSQADVPDSTPEDLLSHFLVKGAFNINSTSKDAWRAVLSGGWLDDWIFSQLTGENDTVQWTRKEAAMSLKNAFLRFIHTGNETFTAPDNWKDEHPMGDVKNKYYRRGVRRLTHAQIDAMAQIIVKKIKKRGAPYASVGEFLSYSVTSDAEGPSLLEYALNPEENDDQKIYTASKAEFVHRWTVDEMSADGKNSGQEEGDIDKGAPADLSQADLLNTLAPVLQARSDTFKIRAYGDVKGSDGSLLAKAVCELTVQRFPEPLVDAALTANRLNPGDTGRRFKIISIKWLNDI